MAGCAGLVCAAVMLASGPAAPGAQYGHNKDYTTIQGQLIWSGIEGGHWQICIADPKQGKGPGVHGRFTLGTPKQLRGFKHGEFVEITGRPRPDMASIWMTGTIYDVKTVKRLGPPPAPPKLSPAERTLVDQAQAMRKAGTRFPKDFAPANDLKVTYNRTTRELLFILIESRDGQWSPQIIDGEADAKAALLAHIAKPTGNYVGGFRRAGRIEKDEAITRSAVTGLYHRFDTAFTAKGGAVYHLVYVVFRPGFLKAVTGQYTQWRRAGGKGMQFGKTALADEKAFGRAADLLCFLMHQRGGPYLLSRSVTREGDRLRWQARLAHYIAGPTSDRDWRFEDLTITADTKTGAATIAVQAAHLDAPGRGGA